MKLTKKDRDFLKGQLMEILEYVAVVVITAVFLYVSLFLLLLTNGRSLLTELPLTSNTVLAFLILALFSNVCVQGGKLIVLIIKKR